MVRPIAEEKGLRMVFQGIPSDQRIGTPHALGRVLLNLVTNALKFTDEGSVEVQVRATTQQRVEFAVTDTGHGIPESAIPHLFRPFRRSTGRTSRPSTGYQFSGTGLGLALCRKLLRSMDSELRYETSVGKGTRFIFELELPPRTHL
jgi:signal transduction histidine kinase